MQKIIIETNQELSEKINHVLEVNRFKANTLTNENQAILLLNIESYQIRLLMQLMRHFKMKNNLNQDDISLYICNEMFFFNEN